jgi:signal transduction histidine kinase
MKNSIAILIILLTIAHFGCAQEMWLNSINRAWADAKHDTTRVLVLTEFANYYKNKRSDSTLIYGYRALTLARKINFPKGEVKAILYLSMGYSDLGNESKTLQLTLQAIKICEKINLINDKAYLIHGLGLIYYGSKDYAKALTEFKRAVRIFDLVNDSAFVAITQNHIGRTYLAMNQLDSALYYAQTAYDNAFALDHLNNGWLFNPILLTLGKIQNKKGNRAMAMSYFKQSLSKAREVFNFIVSNFAIAQLYQQTEILDSAIFYADKSLELAMKSGSFQSIVDSNILLADIYELKDPKQALQFSKNAIAYKDSINDFINVTMQQTYTDFDEQERKREIEAANIESQNRLRMNAFLGSSFTLIVVAILIFILYRRKQKAKQKIEEAYDQLKATQSQLIQSEKMASLGELTAGIAHEIQNPLNFVNNFSEINKELLEELKVELESGNIDEVRQLADDTISNEEKIRQHGIRADSIVKGMLLHSRTSQGEKEPTDINALADEYLRLAYHGMRAKDKSFNSDFKTDFDPDLPKINVIPQDIGRVLLNLINNAFYAVDKKAREGIDGYKPVVSVSTKYVPHSEGLPAGQAGEDKIEVSVKDNGEGVPEQVRDKIFHPFFTTKPTGQGTGLGLSLSYDIVKAHRGELSVKSEENEGTEFTVILQI